MAMQRWTQVMFLGSLAMAADVGHSANFAGMIWLVLTVMVGLMAVLWMPLAIVLLTPSPAETPTPVRFDRLLRQQALWIVNWLLTGAGLLGLALFTVAQLDRAGFPEDNTGWVTWSLAGLVLVMAIAQIGMAMVGLWRSVQGKTFRYAFAIPWLRLKGDRKQE